MALKGMCNYVHWLIERLFYGTLILILNVLLFITYWLVKIISTQNAYIVIFKYSTAIKNKT